MLSIVSSLRLPVGEISYALSVSTPYSGPSSDRETKTVSSESALAMSTMTSSMTSSTPTKETGRLSSSDVWPSLEVFP